MDVIGTVIGLLKNMLLKESAGIFHTSENPQALREFLCSVDVSQMSFLDLPWLWLSLVSPLVTD